MTNLKKTIIEEGIRECCCETKKHECNLCHYYDVGIATYKQHLIKRIEKLYATGKQHDKAYDEKTKTCWLCDKEWGLDSVIDLIQEGEIWKKVK